MEDLEIKSIKLIFLTSIHPDALNKKLYQETEALMQDFAMFNFASVAMLCSLTMGMAINFFGVVPRFNDSVTLTHFQSNLIAQNDCSIETPGDCHPGGNRDRLHKAS